ncbi:SecDF P1 head subdomain-containing protein [Nocardia sp. NPDC004722]
MRLSRSVGRRGRAAAIGFAVAVAAAACGGQAASGTAVAFLGRNFDGGIPSAGTMDQARQTVQKRAEGLGLGKTSVSIDTDMMTIVVAGDDGSVARLLAKTGRVLLRPVVSSKPFQVAAQRIVPGRDARQSNDPAVQAATMAGIDCRLTDPLRGGDDATLPLVTCANTGDTVYLLGPAVVDGREISDAKGAMDTRTARYGVTITFTETGTRQFAQYTAANIGKQFAFAVDSQVVSAPVIQSAAYGDQSQIVGNFTKDAADNLAAALRYGALPTILTPQG